MPETRRIRVEVTQEDIDSASPGIHSCPIALALKRITGTHFIVGLSHAYQSGMATDGCPLPTKAREFVKSFDFKSCRQTDPEPFAFDLDIPADLVLNGS